MNVITLIKDWMYALMRTIDNGSIFIKPQKWVYFLYGILAFVFPILVTIWIFDEGDVYFRYSEIFWTKFVAIIAIALFIVYMYLIAYLVFLFWKSRIANIDAHVKVGDNIVAMPLFSHLIKSIGECIGVYVGLLPPVGGALFYLFTLLTGEMDFYHDWHFIGYLLLWALMSFLCVLVAWFIVFLFRFFSERITLLPQIANDVRDLGDIHRAAVMPEEENK